MQVSVESTGALERRMQVEIPEERIAEEVAKRLQSLVHTARIDGFRRGKVPLSIINQRYGAGVRREVEAEIMRDSYSEALRAEELLPAGQASIEPDEDNEKPGLTYTAIFEVYPEIKVNPLSDISVEIPACEVTDADVDKMLETLRGQRKSWKEVDRAAKEGDQITADFTGYIDDEKFDGGEASDFDIELGSGQLIAGFEDGLIGKKASDNVSLDLEFPDPYGNAALAGKPVRFEVDVKCVSEVELPEIDDEFLKLFNIEEGGIEALKAELRKNMERECQQHVKNRTKNNVLTALHENNQVDIPETLVAGESQQLLEAARQRFISQGITGDHVDSMTTEMFVDEARKRVALGLLMSELIKVNELTADPEKVRTTLESMAASYEDPAAVVQYYYGDKERLANIQTMVLEEDIVDLIIAQAKVETSPIEFDALMNPEA